MHTCVYAHAWLCIHMCISVRIWVYMCTEYAYVCKYIYIVYKCIYICIYCPWDRGFPGFWLWHRQPKMCGPWISNSDPVYEYCVPYIYIDMSVCLHYISVNVYMCMCIYIYIYLYIFIDTYTHACIFNAAKNLWVVFFFLLWFLLFLRLLFRLAVAVRLMLSRDCAPWGCGSRLFGCACQES